MLTNDTDNDMTPLDRFDWMSQAVDTDGMTYPEVLAAARTHLTGWETTPDNRLPRLIKRMWISDEGRESRQQGFPTSTGEGLNERVVCLTHTFNHKTEEDKHVSFLLKTEANGAPYDGFTAADGTEVPAGLSRVVTDVAPCEPYEGEQVVRSIYFAQDAQASDDLGFGDVDDEGPLSF